VIGIFAVLFKVPNVSKNGGASRFDWIRIILFVGVLLADIIYAIIKNS
jgi:hypothetical protein